MDVKYLYALAGIVIAVIGVGIYGQITGYAVSHDATQIYSGTTPLIGADGKINSTLLPSGGGVGAVGNILIPVTGSFNGILNKGDSPVYIQPVSGKIKIYYYIPYYQMSFNGAPVVSADTMQRIVIGGKTGATINVTHGLYYVNPKDHPTLANASIVNLGNSSSARIIKLVTSNLVGYSVTGVGCTYGTCDTGYSWLVEETMDNVVADETNIKDNFELYGYNPSAISVKLNVDCYNNYAPFCDTLDTTGITGIRVFSA